MAFVITLNFNYEINTSLQVGDNVYHSTPNQQGGFDVIDSSNPPVHVGTVYSIISPNEIEILSTYEDSPGIPTSANYPTSSSFISFSKDGIVNRNELTGYYASVKLKNNSNEYAELFTLSANIEESSK